MNDICVLPSEVLFKIFSNLDRETLINLKDVCEKWRSVVHDISWQFLSGSVRRNRRIEEAMIGCGWLEEIHDWRDCKCLDIHLQHFPFRNCSYSLEKLDHRDLRNFPTKMSATQVFIPSVYEEFLVVNRHQLHRQYRYIPDVVRHKVPGKMQVQYACYENTLAFFLEGLEDFSIWNRNHQICHINFLDHFDFEGNRQLGYCSSELTKNKLAAFVSCFGEETDFHVLFWNLDTLEPSYDNINFWTRMKINLWNTWGSMGSISLHLNDIFFCVDNDDLLVRKLMIINFVDHSDDTKHKMIQFDTDDFDDITIEEGESNRIALFKKTEMVFKLFNLESGMCMMNMDLMYILSDFVRGPLNCFNFCMGNMVFICPMKKACHDIESFQYIILTEDGEVVIGDNVEVDPEEWKIEDTETSVTHMDLVSFVVVTEEARTDGLVDRKIYSATRDPDQNDENVKSNLVVINPAV